MSHQSAGNGTAPAVGTILAFTLLAATARAQASQYRIVALGLTDAAHGAGARLESNVMYRGPNDVALGYSEQLGIPASAIGRSAWVYQPAWTAARRIGLWDAEHSGPNGSSNSMPVGGDSAGRVAGEARQYAGGGQSAWLFDPLTSATHRAGFFDALHTRADGLRYSEVEGMNGGVAAGTSSRFNGSASYGQTTWVARGPVTTQIGLIDPEHTRADGLIYNALYNSSSVGAGGHVIGTAYRYNSGSVDLGRSAWRWDPASDTTARIGLVDVEHTRNDGYRFSRADYLDAAGRVQGVSQRFGAAGAGSFGESAWVDDATAGTRRIGFTDAEHTRADGYQFSEPYGLFGGDLAVGRSERYAGMTAIGRSAWLFDGASNSTTRLGLTDAEHTAADGTQFSGTSGYNHQARYILGWSMRYSGGAFELGGSIWVHHVPNATTAHVGLFDAAHTSSDGRRRLLIERQNLAGHIVGTSYRYNGTSISGQSVWVFDPSDDSTTRAGLFDSQHTGSDARQQSTPVQLNARGDAVGYSSRYNGTSSAGQSAWAYDAQSRQSTRMGLFGTEHSTASGAQSSLIDALGESGHVAGTSARYNGSQTLLGRSAWVYDPSDRVTTRTGLFDAQHTDADDGSRFSAVRKLNDNGACVGFSSRFVGGTYAGYSGWYFDPADRQTIPLVFSVRDGDNYAETEPGYLADDGTVLGRFKLYDGAATVGDRAFLWSQAGGFQDLGMLVDGGLGASGWAALYTAWDRSDVGGIAGAGLLLGQTADNMPFLLRPVPEPVGLLGCGAVAAWALRRERRRPSS